MYIIFQVERGCSSTIKTPLPTPVLCTKLASRPGHREGKSGLGHTIETLQVQTVFPGRFSPPCGLLSRLATNITRSKALFKDKCLQSCLPQLHCQLIYHQPTSSQSHLIYYRLLYQSHKFPYLQSLSQGPL